MSERRVPSAQFAQSVRDRLRSRAQARDEEYNFVLNRYAVERFLYRLSRTPHRERFVLKGATLLAAWATQPYRATLDVDFAGFGASDPASLEAVFREVSRAEVEDDGLAFDADRLRVEPIRGGDEYGGVRVRTLARLGSAQIPFQIDISFGNAITPPAGEIAYPVLLPAFPAPHLRAYPRETVVAEKWEAMISLGITNSRLKDFTDVWILARDFPFDGHMLAAAMRATFTRRGTALPIGEPVALTPTFTDTTERRNDWAIFLKRNKPMGVPATLVATAAALVPFLMPPTQALAAGGMFAGRWEPGGPWQDASNTDSVEEGQ